MNGQAGMLGIFDGVDALILAIGKLREAGMKRLVVYSPAPDHNIEHALHQGPSPVRLFTLVGGLTGAAAGFALPTWTSLDWPLITGGKPIIALPAWVIIGFELTVLFGALSTVLGLFVLARLPHRKPLIIYDPSFSVDRYGLHVVPTRDRMAEARTILRESGAVEVRESVQEATNAPA